jgi:hypothetical protein
MKRTALFLKEEQRKKLKKLSDKTGAPLRLDFTGDDDSIAIRFTRPRF